MKKNQVSRIPAGITFNLNLSAKQDYASESYLDEILGFQKANLQYLKSLLIYLKKRDEILKRFKHEYCKIVSRELGKILMKYYSDLSKDETGRYELDQMILNYNAKNVFEDKNPISSKLKLTSVYEKNSLNDKDKKQLEQINNNLIREFKKLFNNRINNFIKVRDTSLNKKTKDSSCVTTHKWKKRTPPYDCAEQFFIPFHFNDEGEFCQNIQESDVNGNLISSTSWNNKNALSNSGEGSSTIDYESKVWVGIRLKNNNPGKLKVILKLKCTDYSFANSSYNSDCVASSFYTNIRNEILFRVNSDIEHGKLLNGWCSDINSDPYKIGSFHEYFTEGDVMILDFGISKLIPANSILWIGLRNRVFSFHENLETSLIQRESLRVEEIGYVVS